MKNEVPRVFISYSHDSRNHKIWVQRFSTILREKGVDAVLDQWDLKPGKDIALFMEEQLYVCDRAILICTKNYVEKANAGKGGVGYERMIVSSELIKDIDTGKFIPIIREQSEPQVPKFIETKFYLDFSKGEYFEQSLDDLLRTLFDAEIASKPPLGVAPKFEDSDKVADRTVIRPNSNLSLEAFEIFEQMVIEYDKDIEQYWESSEFAGRLNIGRITIDAALLELQDKNYVDMDYNQGMYYLTDSGKVHAKKIGIV